MQYCCQTTEGALDTVAQAASTHPVQCMRGVEKWQNKREQCSKPEKGMNWGKINRKSYLLDVPFFTVHGSEYRYKITTKDSRQKWWGILSDRTAVSNQLNQWEIKKVGRMSACDSPAGGPEALTVQISIIHCGLLALGSHSHGSRSNPP